MSIEGRTASATYTADSNLWIHQTAQLLQERRWQEIDIEHLIEEIGDVGKSERRGIASQLICLLLHLLKWQYPGVASSSATPGSPPQRRSDSWLDSITDARTQIELALKDSPSLKGYAAAQVEQSYQRVRRQAAKQTGMSLSVFPEECAYSLKSVLAESCLPESN